MTINTIATAMKVVSGGTLTQPDNTPDQFTFVDQTNVAINTVTESQAFTIAGMDSFATADISIDVGEYQIDSGLWFSASGTVTEGQSVRVRNTSSSSTGTSVNSILTIDGVSDTFTTTTIVSGTVNAFPGAEGFGSLTRGAAGYTGTQSVVIVSNLNDSNVGSFRDAVDGTGKEGRFIVFTVSGIINLESSLNIESDYMTIAGQTSPGGILITGYTTIIRGSNIIVRHMRFRCGSHRIADGADPEQLDSLDIWGPNNLTNFDTNVIVDHCSISWGVDENTGTAYNLRKATYSHCIISEGLSQAGHPKGEHSKGMLIWAKFSPDISVTLHHCFFAHNRDRNPLINTAFGGPMVIDVVNCVSYNSFGGLHMGATHGCNVNWVHNFVQAGPDSNANFYEMYHITGPPIGEQVYVLGNMGQNRLTQTGSEWLVAANFPFALQSENYRSLTPHPVSDPVTTTTMSPAYAQTVVDEAGATKPVRDSHDIQMALDFTNGTGTYRLNVSYPSDFPTFSTPTAPTDTDSDGIPDSYEISQGFTATSMNPFSAAPSGYLWIEEYINGLA